MTATNIETVLVNAGRPTAAGAPLNHPVAAASNFSPGGEHWYARSDGTETVDAFEQAMGALEGGTAVAFASGMAAVAAVLDHVPIGGTIARSLDVYHGAASLIDRGVARGRWKLQVLDPQDNDGWTRAGAACDLLWLESPSNPRLDILDLPSICSSASRKAVIAVDSTFATPLYQQPLSLGADFVVHSATKFIGGHSDLLAGVVVTTRADLVDHVKTHRTLGGAAPGALEVFLALRGLRTLSVRMERATVTALELAHRLESHSSVNRVRFPGLATDTGHAAAARFMTGYGSVLAFEVSDDAAADRVVCALRIVHHATSLGGVESTAERRSGYPGSDHIPGGLIRMSVGCEHVEDLWGDLDRALSEV